jgi:hypothetical protein
VLSWAGDEETLRRPFALISKMTWARRKKVGGRNGHGGGVRTMPFVGPEEERSRWYPKGNDGQRWSSIKASVP